MNVNNELKEFLTEHDNLVCKQGGNAPEILLDIILNDDCPLDRGIFACTSKEEVANVPTWINACVGCVKFKRERLRNDGLVTNYAWWCEKGHVDGTSWSRIKKLIRRLHEDET